MNETLAQRVAELERQNRDLQAEVAGLRPRAATAAAPPPLLGQGPRPHGDATGAHFCGGQAAEPNGSPVAGSAGWSFNSYRTLSSGERVYAPDGVVRDPVSGEALPQWPTRTAEVAPQLSVRSSAHQSQIDLLDKLMAREAQYEAVREAVARASREED